MSKRTENWLNDWERTTTTKFASDIRTLIGTARAAIQAVEVLQQSQRHDPENAGEMQTCSQGDWVSIHDVMNAIKILQDKEK